MLLKDILKNMDYEVIQGDINQEISALTYDSREKKVDSLFVCIKGFTLDGHDKAQEAVGNGARAILVEREIPISDDITVIKVADTRNGMAKAAVNFYNKPADSLNVIGITGTNGKTSITHFLKVILDQADKKTGIIGTLGTLMNEKIIPTNNTTPEAIDLQRFLSDMKDSEHDYCLMEVSSHSLQLKRSAYTSFSTGIFTNLSPDHLELHKTMDDYFEAKAELFTMTNKFNIVNVDDFYGQKLVQQLNNPEVKTLSYGIHEKADFYATDINYSFDQTTFTVHTPNESAQITIHLPGEIYVSNSLAAIAAAYCNGINMEAIQNGLNTVKNISGRLETVYKQGDFRVVVDFAHTEDALQKALTVLRPFVSGRLILVFGVYADMSENGRDKRYGMGRVAAEYADFSIVTLDNPKKHDIKTIMKETTDALERNKGSYIAIEDRAEAIRCAIEMSHSDDCILLAGKGHETTQIIGDREIHFSEKEIVQEAMQTKTF
ncbi:UDP-N-acetylmuramoyl-L-alanyl-D-glutamate--2,6-diaminopimelate ligase [Oceanobacillus indicireducens]|uniref:UDP-N-acetylmuramyl-tripeptide synthetase n=1 Tax=Oceanobacillus indicireducens TaxID=1004261 RepID=A0A918CY41_9BACI|nr:UDP-N-acetylmuramoyl-L-alanyl-D-glutamate--2,6-diaminopimelate ligase [Oceanobacillus indicireducens]GGN48655.1 UDP-N-acetylmuramoyl-L-alanyl-D-glutamate--2,6-diaminopimelate ligase [Oceanobacillus indicireducens]